MTSKKEKEEINKRLVPCAQTASWPVNREGNIQTIMTDKNRLNKFGIKHQHGKLKGQLKKNKLLTEKDIQKALDELNNE